MKISNPVLIIFLIFMTASISYAADSNSLSVTATVITRGSCSFTSHTSALNFGNLDPSNSSDVTASTTISFTCFRGVRILIWWFYFNMTYYIDDDDGQHETSSHGHRMIHTSGTEYLPYSLTLNPQSENVSGNPSISHTLTITGTVRGEDYQNAMMGNYQDSVVVSIVP